MTGHSDTLTPELSALILQFIDSVPHLEAIVLLWDDTSRAWVETDIARRIYQPVEAVRGILRDLQRHGFVERREEGYRIADDTAVRDRITRIVTAYKYKVSQVATLIHSRAPQPVREFARAFEIRGDKGKGDKK